MDAAISNLFDTNTMWRSKTLPNLEAPLFIDPDIIWRHPKIITLHKPDQSRRN